jgi:hypothetical protein
MAKRATLVLSLLFFVLSSIPTEGCLLNFEAPSQAFASTDDLERSHSSRDASGLLSRLLRGKSSIKNLASFDTTTSQERLAAWLHGSFFGYASL